jgi:tryptophan synthase beta subunit
VKRKNEARKICTDKKWEMINNEIRELEIEYRKNENRRFYKKLETLTKTYKPRNTNIKACDGSVLTDKKGILNRWNKHSKENRVRNHLSFMKMSRMTILMKR